MARRLSVDDRRAEILMLTRRMLAEKGPEGLSLRGVARWCGMSAPGLLHHFDGLTPLLEAVLAQRDQEEMTAFVSALPADPTLLQWADTVVHVVALNAEENRRFDALEAQALADPEHPLFAYYRSERDRRPFPTTVALAEKDYPKNPRAVVAVLGTVVDGLRFQWLRSDAAPDYVADWNALRDVVFAGFEQFRAHAPEDRGPAMHTELEASS